MGYLLLFLIPRDKPNNSVLFGLNYEKLATQQLKLRQLQEGKRKQYSMLAPRSRFLVKSLKNIQKGR